MKFLLIAGALALVVLEYAFGPMVPVLAVLFALAFGIFRQATRVHRKAWFPAIAALVLFVFIAPAAFAQSSTIDTGSIYSAFLPYLVAIVGALVTALIGWLIALANKKLGISIDDSMRASLQTAARNGAGLALNQLGNQLQGKVIDVKSPAVAAAVTYVAANAPQALAHFGLTPDAVAEKIVALLPQVANTATPPAAT